MPDQKIKCVDCPNEFTFTERDQQFYASQTPPWNPPRRCRPCRAAKKSAREGTASPRFTSPEVVVEKPVLYTGGFKEEAKRTFGPNKKKGGSFREKRRRGFEDY